MVHVYDWKTMMTIRHVLRMGLIALLPVMGWGEVTLQLSRTEMSQDETTSLTLKVEGGLKRLPPNIPLPEGLRVLGTSRQDMTVNFKRETRVVYEIGAAEPGTYRIGPYSLDMSDGKHELPQLLLTVTPPKVLQDDKQLFATLEPSSERVYIKQPLDVTLTFFSQNPIEDIKVLEFPTEGFETGDWQEIRARNQVFNGKTYRVKRYVSRMIPKKEGVYTFDPTFRVRVQEPGELQRDPSFGMFRRRYELRTLRIQLPEPGQVEVRSPPTEGRPDSFTGHIGRFELRGSLSPEQVTAGDPVTLRVQLTGRGSIREALPPRVEESEAFNVYDPKLIEEDMRRDGLSGIKTIEQVIIPRHAGITELPEIAFSYFDPELEEYQTTTLGPFPLQVKAAAGSEEGNRVVSSLPDGELLITGPNVLGDDLVYLKRSPGTLRPLGRPVLGWSVTAGAVAPLGLWAVAAMIGLVKQHQNRNPGQTRRRSASKELRVELETLAQLEPDELYPRMWGILSSYLQKRLELPPGDLDAASISAHLPSSVQEETREELLTWVTQCEQARFSGGAALESGQMQQNFCTCLLKLDQELDT